MPEVHTLVDHLFRRQSGRMVAGLTRILGARNLDLAEEAVQDALIKALQLWPFQGVPDNPPAWLVQVAKNRALDRLRREAGRQVPLEDDLLRWQNPAPQAVADEELAMIFLCCHPALPGESAAALTLKAVCGFSTAEIARALLADEATVAQRIVRAKRQIREQAIELVMPVAGGLAARLPVVLAVIYLLFNEGYLASAQESLLRQELCDEAIRLTRLMADHAELGRPEVFALLSLMLFHTARRHARHNEAGDLVRLNEQDRARWDQGQIAEAYAWLERSISGDQLTTYHLEAGIAAEHCAAVADWQHVVDLYDILYERTQSPVVALNRAVALGKLHGPEVGLAEVRRLQKEVKLRNYYLLPAMEAHFCEEVGRKEEASVHYVEAIRLVSNGPVRRFLERRLGTLNGLTE